MAIRLGRTALLTTTLLSTLLLPALAQAQDAAPTEGLGDIVVTATRSSASVQKVPVAVTAISGEAIARLQINSAKDIGQIAPNVVIVSVTGGSAGITPFIRGGGVTDGANITSEPEVGIYIDDVYQPRAAASFIDALDLERVEVLRGPQGTLYGRNSSAGALKFVTRLPSETMSFKAELGIGSWDEQYGKASFSGPVTEDGRLRAGFSGIYRKRDGGRQYNATLDRKVGAEEFTGFQGDIYYAGDLVNVRLKGFYSNFTSDGLYPVALDPFYAGSDYQEIQPTSGSYRTVLSPTPSYTKDRQYGGSLTINADLSDNWQVSAISAYSKLTDDWAVEFSGGVPFTAFGVPVPGIAALFDRESLSDQSSFSQELQLHGKMFDGFLTFVGGVYYFHESGDQIVDSAIFFTPTLAEYTIDTNSYAAFGQFGVHFNDRLTLSLGGRYTEDHKSLDATLNGTPVVRQDKFKDFLPKASLDFQVTPNLLTYASYSEGFKAGGYNGLASTPEQLDSPFAPQKVKAYEIGIKSEFLDHKARVNLSAFINKYSSIQQQYVTPAGDFLTENYQATHKGIEAEISLRPIPELTLWANGVYNDGTYEGAASTANATSFVGNRMTNVFKYQGTLGADLAVGAGPGKFVLGGNYTARSGYFATPDNSFIGQIAATNIVNAYVGYELDKWSLRLSAKNLTDDRYWTTGFGFSVVRPRFMGDPRTWRLSLGYQF